MDGRTYRPTQQGVELRVHDLKNDAWFLFQLGNSDYYRWTNLWQIYHLSVYIMLSENWQKRNWFTKPRIFIYQFFFLPFCLCLLGSCRGMDRLKFCRHCRHCRFWLKLREGAGQQLWRGRWPMLQHRRGWCPVEQRGTFTRLWFECWGCWFEV